MWHSDMHTGWMMVFWIAFVVISAIGLRYALGGMGRPTANDDSPESILKRRYARGEIDQEEYQSRLADLRK